VEIIHECLIQGWPTLRRWLDESHEDGVFLEQVRVAARQWDAKGRPVWLLWTGEAADQAQRFSRRYKGELGTLEHDYLTAVVRRATRATRRRRAMVVGAFAFLILLVAAAGVALMRIQSAERLAHEQRAVAEAEAERARGAERRVSEQLVLVREKERARLAEEIARQSAEAERETARNAASVAESAVAKGRQQLALTNEQLEAALGRVRKEAERSAALAEAERAAKEEVSALLEQERNRVKLLEEQRQKISTELK
jgi:eukaryotic-like serine/threonine-protein kinase